MLSKKIALIGANGQLGSDILNSLKADKKYKIFSLTHQDIEILNFKKTYEILNQIKPDIVINTAAYHKVDEAELNPDKALSLNSLAQKNLAQICQQNNWAVVYISSDYVFGQEKRHKPYRESDSPAPVNVYGVSKICGEYFTRYASDKHLIIRTSGLYGAKGSSSKGLNFVELMIKLGKEKGEVSVVSDQVLSPTYTINLANNLKSLLDLEVYGLFHASSQGSCSWWEFASTIFKFLSMDVKCKSVTSKSFKSIVKRPSYSVLENDNLSKLKLDQMKTWQQNLRDYLKEKKYL